MTVDRLKSIEAFNHHIQREVSLLRDTNRDLLAQIASNSQPVQSVSHVSINSNSNSTSDQTNAFSLQSPIKRSTIHPSFSSPAIIPRYSNRNALGSENLPLGIQVGEADGGGGRVSSISETEVESKNESSPQNMQVSAQNQDSPNSHASKDSQSTNSEKVTDYGETMTPKNSNLTEISLESTFKSVGAVDPIAESISIEINDDPAFSKDLERKLRIAKNALWERNARLEVSVFVTLLIFFYINRIQCCSYFFV